MRTFVVERFIPALTPSGVRAEIERERAALERIASENDGVRHVRTTYLRDDELCFSVFEAPSLGAVRDANERAGLAFERITEAIDADATTSMSDAHWSDLTERQPDTTGDRAQ